MATLTSVQAATDFPVHQPAAGEVGVAFGTLAITANPTAADVWRMCKLPAGAVFLEGKLYASDLDTNGTPTLDMDVGILGATVTDSDFFGNFGVVSGDAVSGYKPGVGVVLPLAPTVSATNLSGALVTLTEATIVTITVNTAAATFAAGNVTLYVMYTMPIFNVNL